jgi:YD repeat-containing protein
LAPGAWCTADGVPRVCQDCFVNKCPRNAAAETCPTCSSRQPVAGAPISLATGNTFIVQTDVSIPGLSGGLTLARTWNSRWPSSQSGFKYGMFGPNWRSTFEERVFVGGDSTLKYARADGSFWSFGFTNYITQSGTIVGSAYSVVAPANSIATLTTGTPNWTVTFENGEKRLFNSTSGSLVSIVDRNGNTTQLAYDSANRVVTVTDPAGRHVYFAYADNSSYWVTAVTSDVGISLSYSYDNQGRLARVTRPDQTWVSFEYDSNSLITAVKDSDGKILESHTYDTLGRGLFSSRAEGVDAVTVSYPKPAPPN